MPGTFRRLVHVFARVAVLSLALVFVETTAASAAGKWAAPSEINSPNDLVSVSCPSVNFCAAVNDGGYTLTNTLTPTTSVVIPATGAKLSGSTYLDASASNASGVEFWLLGGSYGYSGKMLCAAALTYYGWLCSWNTTTVPNGSYALVSEASNTSGSAYSAGVSITVSNSQPPPTSVLVPATGATVSGSTTLDASASNASGVEFWLLGGSYGYSGKMLCAAALTYYGWLCPWNTTTVPNGSYTLLSEAFNSVGSTYSAGVSITVGNPPTTSLLIPSNGATLSGSAATLDASASNATSVEFRLLGGSYGYSGPVVCTATLTFYGWLCYWNTTTVPDGSYVLVSEAINAFGSAFSPGVSITVKN